MIENGFCTELSAAEAISAFPVVKPTLFGSLGWIYE